MKTSFLNKFFIAIILLLVSPLLAGNTYSQTISERSGRQPDYIDWSGGKKIKYASNSDENDIRAGRYLFVSEETLPAYYRENGKEYGYRPNEVVRSASDNLRAELAALIRSRILDSAEKNLKMDGIKREEFRKNVFKFFTEVSLSGLIKEGHYYHKENYSDYADYHAWVLYSINVSNLENLISIRMEEVSSQIDIDSNFTQNLIDDIRTSVESLDESDLN